MASLIPWAWVWASSGRWWRTGKPGMLKFMGSQRVEHNWRATIFHCVHILHCLHLFLIGHIDHLHVLSITNNAAVTSGVQISLQHWYNFFRKYTPRSQMAESYSSWFLISLKLYAVFHSYQWDMCSLASHPHQYLLSLVFLTNHSTKCEVISHYGFDLHFPDVWWCWTSFHVLIGHLYVACPLKKCLMSFVHLIFFLNM